MKIIFAEHLIQTFVKSSPGQCFKFVEAVKDESMFFFGVRGHVSQLLDIAIANAKGEHCDPKLELQNVGSRSGVSPVAVAIRYQKHSLRRVISAQLEEKRRKANLYYIYLLGYFFLAKSFTTDPF